MLLVSVGQPIITDDLWWHLGLGRAFAALAAYRLLQLRPDLVSIAASLLCYRWLLADERPPSPRRIAAVAVLSALWANLHAGFPLGSMIIAAAVAGLVLAAPLRPPEARRADRARALRLALALAVAGLATLANPSGIRAHLAYLVAGASTPSLDRIMDEWAALHLFALPGPPQPSPIAWTLAWALVLGMAWIAVRWIASERARRELDPAKLALSLLSLCLMISAVRFVWIGIFPLLLFAGAAGASLRVADRSARAVPRTATAIAATACLLAAGFVKLGEQKLVSRDEIFQSAYYRRPYAAAKHHAHAIWVLADSGVRGNLYTDYFIGGFAGYWLAPEVRTLVNGTLNVPSESLDALVAIAQRRGLRPGEEFAALLDRLGIDLFLGIRLPELRRTASVGIATTAHLENTRGWIAIFRNLTSAIYLRANDRNRANLERVADYYAAQHVPFDRERGFDVDAAIRDAPDWAIAHGVVPIGFVRLAHNMASGHASSAVRDRVATISAVLGGYRRSVAIDRGLVREEPQAVRPKRRLVWSLLRLGQFEDAAEAAALLEARPAGDGFSAWISETARGSGAMDPEAARTAVAALAFLTAAEGSELQNGLEPPEVRPPR